MARLVSAADVRSSWAADLRSSRTTTSKTRDVDKRYEASEKTSRASLLLVPGLPAPGYSGIPRRRTTADSASEENSSVDDGFAEVDRDFRAPPQPSKVVLTRAAPPNQRERDDEVGEEEEQEGSAKSSSSGAAVELGAGVSRRHNQDRGPATVNEEKDYDDSPRTRNENDGAHRRARRIQHNRERGHCEGQASSSEDDGNRKASVASSSGGHPEEIESDDEVDEQAIRPSARTRNEKAPKIQSASRKQVRHRRHSIDSVDSVASAVSSPANENEEASGSGEEKNARSDASAVSVASIGENSSGEEEEQRPAQRIGEKQNRSQMRARGENTATKSSSRQKTDARARNYKQPELLRRQQRQENWHDRRMPARFVAAESSDEESVPSLGAGRSEAAADRERDGTTARRDSRRSHRRVLNSRNDRDHHHFNRNSKPIPGQRVVRDDDPRFPSGRGFNFDRSSRQRGRDGRGDGAGLHRRMDQESRKFELEDAVGDDHAKDSPEKDKGNADVEAKDAANRRDESRARDANDKGEGKERKKKISTPPKISDSVKSSADEEKSDENEAPENAGMEAGSNNVDVGAEVPDEKSPRRSSQAEAAEESGDEQADPTSKAEPIHESDDDRVDSRCPRSSEKTTQKKEEADGKNVGTARRRSTPREASSSRARDTKSRRDDEEKEKLPSGSRAARRKRDPSQNRSRSRAASPRRGVGRGQNDKRADSRTSRVKGGHSQSNGQREKRDLSRRRRDGARAQKDESGAADRSRGRNKKTSRPREQDRHSASRNAKRNKRSPSNGARREKRSFPRGHRRGKRSPSHQRKRSPSRERKVERSLSPRLDEKKRSVSKRRDFDRRSSSSSRPRGAQKDKRSASHRRNKRPSSVKRDTAGGSRFRTRRGRRSDIEKKAGKEAESDAKVKTDEERKRADDDDDPSLHLGEGDSARMNLVDRNASGEPNIEESNNKMSSLFVMDFSNAKPYKYNPGNMNLVTEGGNPSVTARSSPALLGTDKAENLHEVASAANGEVPASSAARPTRATATPGGQDAEHNAEDSAVPLSRLKRLAQRSVSPDRRSDAKSRGRAEKSEGRSPSRTKQKIKASSRAGPSLGRNRHSRDSRRGHRLRRKRSDERKSTTRDRRDDRGRRRSRARSRAGARSRSASRARENRRPEKRGGSSRRRRAAKRSRSWKKSRSRAGSSRRSSVANKRRREDKSRKKASSCDRERSSNNEKAATSSKERTISKQRRKASRSREDHGASTTSRGDAKKRRRSTGKRSVLPPGLGNVDPDVYASVIDSTVADEVDERDSSIAVELLDGITSAKSMAKKERAQRRNRLFEHLVDQSTLGREKKKSVFQDAKSAAKGVAGSLKPLSTVILGPGSKKVADSMKKALADGWLRDGVPDPLDSNIRIRVPANRTDFVAELLNIDKCSWKKAFFEQTRCKTFLVGDSAQHAKNKKNAKILDSGDASGDRKSAKRSSDRRSRSISNRHGRVGRGRGRTSRSRSRRGGRRAGGEDDNEEDSRDEAATLVVQGASCEELRKRIDDILELDERGRRDLIAGHPPVSVEAASRRDQKSSGPFVQVLATEKAGASLADINAAGGLQRNGVNGASNKNVGTSTANNMLLMNGSTASVTAGVVTNKGNSAGVLIPGTVVVPPSSHGAGVVQRTAVLGGDARDKVKCHESVAFFLKTSEHAQIFERHCNVAVQCSPSEKDVVFISGTAETKANALNVLKRAIMHAQWGSSTLRLKQLFAPRQEQKKDSICCRLTPMTNALPAHESMLSAAKSRIKVGKDKEKVDLVLEHPAISRQHCIIDYDHRKGGVFIHDYSTNGTYLNSKRLPPKGKQRVFLCHGDEILFKNEQGKDEEFGYIVNLVATG
ncbi:unnamed protein product [Amoebophrya sp. A25]|nr:unnamed protein product [Amoebophrya sp. A25]|eukprot:GSA25T00012110001.1